MSDVNKMPEVLNDYRVYDENGSTLYGIAKFEQITHNINSDWNLKLVGGRAVALEARGANQYWDSGANKYVMDTVRVVIRGRSKAMAGGSWEPASTVDATNTIETTYIKYEVNGKTLLEVDKYAYKFVAGGEDIMQPIRDALGV